MVYHLIKYYFLFLYIEFFRILKDKNVKFFIYRFSLIYIRNEIEQVMQFIKEFKQKIISVKILRLNCYNSKILHEVYQFNQQ